MGGKNSAYIWGPLQMAAGAALTATGAGAPIGIPLMTAGAGETIGKAAGGSKGAGMGEMFGGLAGGLGEGGFGLAGMGPMGNMLGTTGAGQGLQGMLGMQPSGGQQLLDIASGKFGAGPGGMDPLLQQGAGDLATYEGITGAPGYASVPGMMTPTAEAAGGGGGFTGMLNTASKVAPVANVASGLLGGGGTSTTSAQSTPAFKSPITQAPIAAKGQAPVTTVTPTVTQVPQRRLAGGRTSQDAYRKLLLGLSGGDTGIG